VRWHHHAKPMIPEIEIEQIQQDADGQAAKAAYF
jgi:hypothetical protein